MVTLGAVGMLPPGFYPSEEQVGANIQDEGEMVPLPTEVTPSDTSLKYLVSIKNRNGRGLTGEMGQPIRAFLGHHSLPMGGGCRKF